MTDPLLANCPRHQACQFGIVFGETPTMNFRDSRCRDLDPVSTRSDETVPPPLHAPRAARRHETRIGITYDRVRALGARLRRCLRKYWVRLPGARARQGDWWRVVASGSQSSTYPSTPEFRKHSANVAEIQQGLVQLERAHKAAIRSGDVVAIRTMRRLHQLVIGVHAEAMLRKIVTDPSGFNDPERTLIWGGRDQLARWRTTVDLAFRRHYGVLIHQPLDATFLPAVAADRHRQMSDLLSTNLGPVITDRNKTAHGQWAWQLRSGRDNEFLEHQQPEAPNYVVLRSQSQLIRIIARLVHVLAVSEPTFDRDFDGLIEELARERSLLDGATYSSFVNSLRPRPVNV